MDARGLVDIVKRANPDSTARQYAGIINKDHGDKFFAHNPEKFDPQSKDHQGREDKSYAEKIGKDWLVVHENDKGGAS